MAHHHSSTLDGLPNQFVTAMRTLFEIMDDKKTGYIKFSEIEVRWQDDGTKGLPKGVIDCLRKVTPQNGLLSFERFCAGLKICLLRNQVERSQGGALKQKTMEPIASQPVRPPSAPILDADSSKNWAAANMATVRPSIISQQRTLSMPQLLTEKKEKTQLQAPDYVNDTKATVFNKKSNGILYGPPKPPRTAVGLEKAALSTEERNVGTERNFGKQEIRMALQHWQRGFMMNDKASDKCSPYPSIDSQTVVKGSRSSGDGKPAGQSEQTVAPHKKPLRRKEPRRHTLQNGIDYNMLKRMKQIEQEQDLLMHGLQAVEQARDWYLKQIETVQEKMKYLGRVGSHLEQWTEAQQERLELQRARVLEVNRHLVALVNSWERGGLPLHMNLAVNHITPPSMLSQLKQQNHLLTEEINKKCERITVLEREKASLLRELYQIRSQTIRGNGTQEEPVFM